MFCIDWNDDDPFEIIGESTHDDDYARIDVIVTPCNYLHTLLGYQGDSIHPECVGDLQEQIEYMGASHVLVLLNQQRFNEIGYGDELIVGYSEIQNTQLDAKTPSWVDA